MVRFNFDKIAGRYDDFYISDFGRKVDYVEKRLVKELLEGLPRGLSLELGCGTGHWTEFFCHYGFPIVAIDISEKMLDIARSKNIECAVFVQQDMENMRFKDEYFYNVFAITALEFTDNLDRALSEIYRVLRPQGYFFVGALNAASPYIQERQKKGESLKYARAFTPDQLRNMLSVFGEPVVKAALYIKDGEVLDLDSDFSQQDLLQNGAFLCGVVQKNR